MLTIVIEMARPLPGSSRSEHAFCGIDSVVRSKILCSLDRTTQRCLHIALYRIMFVTTPTSAISFLGAKPGRQIRATRQPQPSNGYPSLPYLSALPLGKRNREARMRQVVTVSPGPARNLEVLASQPQLDWPPNLTLVERSQLNSAVA